MKKERLDGLDTLIPSESEGETLSKSEVKLVLTSLNRLLGRLPDEELEEFAKSKEYELYVKLLKSHDVK